MANKSNLLYKIITIITLAVPLPLYLFLSATLFNITPDYTINHAKITELAIVSEIVDAEEYTYIITTNVEATFSGLVVFIPSEGTYGIMVDSKDIIKVNRNYYSAIKNEETNLYEMIDVKKFAIEQSQRAKFPVAFFVSVLGLLIVFAVVQGKMKWYKQYPRVSAFVGLLTGSVVLFLIDSVVGSLLNVFLIATVSWGVYCLEYLVAQGKVKELNAAKTENDLTMALKNALKK